MSLDEEYTAYVSGRLTWLRRIAYPLCQDWHRADDLVQTAITRLYVKWRQARVADDLDAYVRVILVRVFLAEQRGAGSPGYGRRPRCPSPRSRATTATRPWTCTGH
ncbi:sigma factor [Nonomuraea antimicrobica]